MYFGLLYIREIIFSILDDIGVVFKFASLDYKIHDFVLAYKMSRMNMLCH